MYIFLRSHPATHTYVPVHNTTPEHWIDRTCGSLPHHGKQYSPHALYLNTELRCRILHASMIKTKSGSHPRPKIRFLSFKTRWQQLQQSRTHCQVGAVLKPPHHPSPLITSPHFLDSLLETFLSPLDGNAGRHALLEFLSVRASVNKHNIRACVHE